MTFNSAIYKTTMLDSESHGWRYKSSYEMTWHVTFRISVPYASGKRYQWDWRPISRYDTDGEGFFSGRRIITVISAIFASLSICARECWAVSCAEIDVSVEGQAEGRTTRCRCPGLVSRSLSRDLGTILTQSPFIFHGRFLNFFFRSKWSLK